MQVQVLYLQEWDLTGACPICDTSKKAYTSKIYKMFPKLRALDGNRKNVEGDINLKECIPDHMQENIEYEVDHVEFHNQELIK